MQANGTVRPSAAARSRKYLREVGAELKKVIWPKPRQTLSYTAFVVLSSLVVALIIAGLDAVFNWGLAQFIR